jgi:hypothetical protein
MPRRGRARLDGRQGPFRDLIAVNAARQPGPPASSIRVMILSINPAASWTREDGFARENCPNLTMINAAANRRVHH